MEPTSRRQGRQSAGNVTPIEKQAHPGSDQHTAVSEEIRQRRIDPMVDFAFGILLGSEANKPVLKALFLEDQALEAERREKARAEEASSLKDQALEAERREKARLQALLARAGILPEG